MQATDVPVICMDDSGASGYQAAHPQVPQAQVWSPGPRPTGKKPLLPPGSEKMVAVMSVTIVVLLVASAILANAVFGTRMVSALLSVDKGDVFLRDPRPYGDNLSAIVPVEIEILNLGEGKSGNISVWCGAFSQEQSNLLKADFNTTQLVRVGDPKPVNRISEKEKPGSIVRARGDLRLPPGSYEVRLRIYEDAGKRTLVSGSIDITVNQTMVNINSPYKPQGRSPGRSYEVAASKGAMPGFDGTLGLGAVALAVVAVAASRTSTAPPRRAGLRRNINMDLTRF